MHIRGGHRVGSSASLYLPNTSASGEKEEGAVAGNLASKGGCIPQPFDRPHGKSPMDSPCSRRMLQDSSVSFSDINLRHRALIFPLTAATCRVEVENSSRRLPPRVTEGCAAPELPAGLPCPARAARGLRSHLATGAARAGALLDSSRGAAERAGRGTISYFMPRGAAASI